MRNKKLLIGILSIMTLFLLGGCKKEEEEPAPPESIVVEIDSSIPDPFSLTKKELLALSADEIKLMVETYMPNYREYFKIDADRVMSDEDWLTIRDLICLQLYGSIRDEEAVIEESEPVIEVDDGVDYDDPNWIYYAPKVELIEPMTLDEFAEYLTGSFYYEKENGVYDISDGNTELLEDINFRDLDDESLQMLKDQFLAELYEIEGIPAPEKDVSGGEPTQEESLLEETIISEE